MNRDMRHHQLVIMLNRRARIEAENRRMEAIERRFAPLFWVVVAVICLMIVAT